MIKLHYFYRHPHAIYFSVEKLFKAISSEISSTYSDEFILSGIFLPFTSKLKTLQKNIKFVGRHQATINHITGDTHYVIAGCDKKNINIVTIHDCVVLRKYSVMDPRYRFIKWLWYDMPVRKADAVTVISENTKKELLHFTRCDPDKIKVIRNFIDPAFQPSATIFNEARPRILFIGSTPNKNLDRLIESMQGIQADLDIVGHITDEQGKKLARYKINYDQSSGLTREELLAKYKQCDLLAFPSTYEGFGLPIIEAQAIGRPVLTSDLPPMNEVAGLGACLADPFDIASIRNGLLHIIEDAAYRESLISKGFENVERFRLSEVTKQYVSLYRELLQKKKLG